MADRILDLRGLKCPLPVLHLERALAAMAPRDTVRVLATDPMSAIDIPHCAARGGHALLENSREGAELRFRLIKAG